MQEYFPVKCVFRTVGFKPKTIYELIDGGALPLSPKATVKGVGQRRMINYTDFIYICLAFKMTQMGFEHEFLKRIFAESSFANYIALNFKNKTDKKMLLAYVTLGVPQRESYKMSKKEKSEWHRYDNFTGMVENESISDFKRLMSRGFFTTYTVLDVGKLLDQIQARFKNLMG